MTAPRLAPLAAASLLLAGAAAAHAGPDSSEIAVTVSVPDGGALSINVAEESLDLGRAQLDDERTAWVATGTLPAVTVVDTRVTDPGWSLSAQVSPFTLETVADAGDVEPPSFLPSVLVSPSAGVERALGLALSESVDLGSENPEPGDLLLAWTEAGSGTGTSVVGGEVELRAPLETDAGDYRAVITLTVS